MVIVGSTVLQRRDAAAIYSSVASIAASGTKPQMSDWQTLNVLHRVSGQGRGGGGGGGEGRRGEGGEGGEGGGREGGGEGGWELIIVLFSSQAASQVGALDIGYKPGVTKEDLKNVKFLYLLGEVSSNTTSPPLPSLQSLSLYLTSITSSVNLPSLHCLLRPLSLLSPSLLPPYPPTSPRPCLFPRTPVISRRKIYLKIVLSSTKVSHTLTRTHTDYTVHTHVHVHVHENVYEKSLI